MEGLKPAEEKRNCFTRSITENQPRIREGISVCVCVWRGGTINLLTRDRMMDNGSLPSKYDRNCYTVGQSARKRRMVCEWGPRGNGGDYSLRGESCRSGYSEKIVRGVG